MTLSKHMETLVNLKYRIGYVKPVQEALTYFIALAEKLEDRDNLYKLLEGQSLTGGKNKEDAVDKILSYLTEEKK